MAWNLPRDGGGFNAGFDTGGPERVWQAGQTGELADLANKPQYADFYNNLLNEYGATQEDVVTGGTWMNPEGTVVDETPTKSQQGQAILEEEDKPWWKFWNRGGIASLKNRPGYRWGGGAEGPVGRSPLTRREIAENRWNAIPAGVYDMSGQGKKWFPSIDRKDRPFAYDRRHTPAGGPIPTREQIAENRWNAIPAGVYDMSGNAKTWFPQIDEEVRGFAYDSGLTPAGGPILTQDEIAENRWNAIPEGNIYDMSPGQDYFGPRNEEYEDFPPWFAGGGAVGLEPGIASLMGYAKGGMVTRVKVPKGQSKWMKKFMNNMRDN